MMALRCVTLSATGPRVSATAATAAAITVVSPLRHERDLANAPRRKPLAPQPVGGQQLVQRAASDPRSDVRRVGGERVDQRLRHGAVRPAPVVLPANDETVPREHPVHLVERVEPDRVGVGHARPLRTR